MQQDYPKWLAEQKYSEGTQNAQIYRVKKVEEGYGNLDDHFAHGTYQEIIDALEYSTSDERANKPNPSKLIFEGNIRNNLQSYKNAAVRYLKFLKDDGFRSRLSEPESFENIDTAPATEEFNLQRFSLERDMQAALRKNIKSLDPSLTISDDGAERAVNSGLIDITCEDGNALVVVELKAGKADSRAIGQILGYMGDLHEEEGKPVRGILVTHDFDRRTMAAARVVPTLELKKYSIEFQFISLS
ncbi:endonuclease NucS domain-containing protein [Nitrosospira sp. NRS527]|uniref:endonuclease NucS domain-containing protein n=1 Tax=Nitrosospira sp. NRS527 TaxID=155925 RepID=UPI001AF34405|nr:endonuclease NucS domain-containing protein [Nitrosospira sp. NRS527]BCT69536.1 Endonuclease NucS [Nitrosospira sp. NRS527]